MSEKNPLTKYYRTVAMNVKLPSLGHYYKEGVISLNDDGEVGIMPMTAQDELILKNPDALLSGEAITSVLKSCVVGVVDPKKLLACDVEVLLLAIREASYGDDASINIKCPKCEADNTYKINLDTMLASSDQLEPHYETVLGSGVTVYIVPSNFEATIKQQKVAFENSKIQRIINQSDITDDARLALFSSAFHNLSKINFELVLNSILKVTVTNDEGEVEEVSNKKMISEFLRNITKKEVDQIEDLIAKVNSHGIKKTLDVVCTSCEHTWDQFIEINESNFS